METNIVELVKGVGSLVTLPDVFIRINTLVEDPDSSVVDIAKAVSQDPSFTVRLLRVANSPLYGFSTTVDTVSKAVSIIGTGQVRNLALATSVASTFKGLPNDLVSMENFWHHSVYCALAARILAKQARRCDPEAVFTAGLLHDVGELVIFNRLSAEAKEVLLLVLDNVDELPVYEAEWQIMGFDHAQVGAELARQWHLPPLLEECIEFHHNLEKAQRYPRETALVHIANILAQAAEIDTLDLEDVPSIAPRAWEITGLDADEVVESTIREIQEEISEAEKIFLGK